MQKKKIAILGLGDIARKAYLPVLGVDKSLDLYLYNRSPEALRDIQAQYRIENGSPELKDVIASEPQAAFVLTASPSHFEIARQLLQAGVDVYLEKPATLHSEETEALAELAERQGRILMVGFNRRYAPLHVRAKEAWGSETPGMGIFNKFRIRSSYTTLEAMITDDTIHQIDLLRFYCGEGHALSCTLRYEGDVLLGTTSVVRLESGGIATVNTYFQSGRWQEHYALYGSRQTAEIEAFSEVRFVGKEYSQCWQESYASSWKTTLEGRGFNAQIVHFLECVDTRQTPLTSGRDSVKTQRLLEEIIRLAEHA